MHIHNYVHNIDNKSVAHTYDIILGIRLDITDYKLYNKIKYIPSSQICIDKSSSETASDRK